MSAVLRAGVRFFRREAAALAGLLTLALVALAEGGGAPLPATGAGGIVAFLGIVAVIVGGAIGVVRHAEALGVRLGEPYGTLLLTLSVVGIEVALIAAVMLMGEASPRVARDTMFALLMLVLNGLVGLSLLIGAARHFEQSYNFQGATAFLSVIVPLAVFALVLPAYTVSTDTPTFTALQAGVFSGMTLLLYALFLLIQTTRHRGFFLEPGDEEATAKRHETVTYAAPLHALLLVLTLGPVVLLSRPLAGFVDHGIAVLGLPRDFGGVLIALIVLTPEGLSAVQAARSNRIQRAVNLCLGAALSTIGLTVPAVLIIGLAADLRVVLGLGPVNQILLALTLVNCILTFGARRSNVLQGAVHLVLFLAFLALILSP